MDPESAIKYGGDVAWNKLYRRELFSYIPYPEGRVCEDTAVTHQIVFMAKKIIMISDVLYYRVYRKDSITHAHLEKNIRDGFIAAVQRAENLNSYGCAKETYEPMLWSTTFGLLGRSYPSDDPVLRWQRM